MRRSEFPRNAVLPHIEYIEYARRAPLRAAGLFTAIGVASALGYALGLAAAVGLGAMISATFAQPARAPAAAAAFDPSPYMLNAFLVPALDPDATPLRWVDPRPAMGCDGKTAVWVNGERLKPGELVPDAPFELEWLAQGCRPFGLAGPRFDGGVTLTVFREDWGFSAMVKPFNLRAVSGDTTIPIRRAGASYPQCIEGDGRGCL